MLGCPRVPRGSAHGIADALPDERLLPQDPETQQPAVAVLQGRDDRLREHPDRKEPHEPSHLGVVAQVHDHEKDQQELDEAEELEEHELRLLGVHEAHEPREERQERRQQDHRAGAEQERLLTPLVAVEPDDAEPDDGDVGEGQGQRGSATRVGAVEEVHVQVEGDGEGEQGEEAVLDPSRRDEGGFNDRGQPHPRHDQVLRRPGLERHGQ